MLQFFMYLNTIQCSSRPTLIFLRRVVVVDLLPDALALAQVASQILLLLLIVVAEELLPVVGIHVLLLLDDLPLHFLLRTGKQPQ